MKRFLLQLAAGLMAGLVMIQPVEADALSNAFSTLLSGGSTSTSSGGTFSGQMYTTITGGAYRVNFAPQHTVSLFSFVPPSLNVGCSGISAFSGALSFVNGQQIQAVLQQIAQGVVAGLFLAAVGALCPECEQEITKIEDWLQKASALAINGCHMGMAIAHAMAQTALSAANHKCINLAAKTNTSSDVFAAQQSTCNGGVATAHYLHSIMTAAFGSDFSSTSAGTANACVAMQSVYGAGNTTWALLNNVGAWQTEPYLSILLMSYIGTSNWDKGTATNPSGVYGFSEPTITARQLVGVFMCGTDPSSWAAPTWINQLGGTAQSQLAAAYRGMVQACNQQYGIGTTKGVNLLYCATDKSGSNITTPGAYQSGKTDQKYNACRYVAAAPLSDLGSITFTSAPPIGAAGFEYYILNTLAEGIYDIKNNLPIASSVIQLINISPFPLYKMLNIAAVYPGLSAQIVSDNASALGTVLSLAYLRHIFTTLSKGGNGKILCIPHGLEHVFLVADRRLNVTIKQKFKSVDLLYSHEEQIIQDVKMVNQSILNKVYSEGMMSASFR